MKSTLPSKIGHLCRELLVHVDRWRQPQRRPRVMFMLSDDVSGLLRSRLVAEELHKLGWRTVVVPTQLERCQRERLLRLEHPDIVLLQQHRHPLNDPDLLAGFPLVFDIDDADYLDQRCVLKVRRCVERCELVIAGSRNVANWCRHYQENVEVIWTPTPRPNARSLRPNRTRGPVIVWACSSPEAVPIEAQFVVQTLARAAMLEEFELWIMGVRDVERMRAVALPLERTGTKVRLVRLLPYRRFLKVLEGCAIGLNPLCEAENPYAAGKSFGKTLAYLRSEVAVITTPTVDHPLFFRSGENGIMCDTKDVELWVDSIVGLLRDPERRQSIVDAAYSDFLANLTTEVAAAQLDVHLRNLLGRHPLHDRAL